MGSIDNNNNNRLGTGTAPFRSFWQELDEIKSQDSSFVAPKVWLFFGCRTKSLDLYSDEKRAMVENGILNRVFLALSREKNVPKVSWLIIKKFSFPSSTHFPSLSLTHLDLRTKSAYEGV